MNIIKRNGKEVIFDKHKIVNAITKANNELPKISKLESFWIDAIASAIEKEAYDTPHTLSVEDIQDKVSFYLGKHAPLLNKIYMEYRFKRTMLRKANTTDEQILSLIKRENEEIIQENANKNSIIVSTQRDYMAGEVSKDLCERFLVSEDVWKAHKQGIIHFHDSDYFAQNIHNCCLINLEDMLQNGTVISDTMIEKPKSFLTACNIATQIIAQVASSQYGGQTITLTHLAPFVDVSRQKIIKGFKEDGLDTILSKEKFDKLVDKTLKRKIKEGVQIIQYQIITLMTTNGQAPFITIYMDITEPDDELTRSDLALLIEETLKQRIQGVKNEKGVYITPAFPKLIYALDECNIEPDSKYYYLTELSAKCTAKRMVPDYISLKKMHELKGDSYPCMGCRSFLTPDRFTDTLSDEELKDLNTTKKHKYYGRFNQGVVTINLVDVACSSNKDMDLFWNIFNERLELCHKALRQRHERLLGTPSDVAPILWQNGALARLKKGETIDKLLYNGYSTISLGYAGLYECVKYMTGESHTGKGKEFALKVMQYMTDKCNEWKAKENIDYSPYGTPMESTTYKFAKALQKRFGMIKDVTNHNYITNSYHVCVREEIDAFSKLKIESEFQALSAGGAISYIEVADMQKNLEAVMSVIKYIYDTIMYAELNTKSDFCQVCGFEGEIQLVKNEHKKIIWKCPNCGNTDHNKMNTTRRVCGYLGKNNMNQGRLGEIVDRVLHL